MKATDEGAAAQTRDPISKMATDVTKAHFAGKYFCKGHVSVCHCYSGRNGTHVYLAHGKLENGERKKECGLIPGDLAEAVEFVGYCWNSDADNRAILWERLRAMLLKRAVGILPVRQEKWTSICT